LWRIMRPDALDVLGDERCRRSLKRYFAILEGRKHAKFRIARRIEADFSPDTPLEDLWSLHEKLSNQHRKLEEKLDAGETDFESLPPPKLSYLSLKAEIARRILRECHLCERRCGVNRLKGEKGFCQCGVQAEVSSYFAHLGEEPELVPSGTIFTMGCTIRCLHCQNWTICLAGDTLVPLSDGSLTEISELFDNEVKGKNLKLINGSLCSSSNLSLFTIDHRGKILTCKGNGLSKRKNNILLKIVTRTGKEIKATPNHELYTCVNGIITPIRVGTLKEGDFIATVRRIPEVNHIPKIVWKVESKNKSHCIKITKTLLPDLCRFYGYLVGDGHVYERKNKGIYEIVFTNADQKLLEDYCKCFLNVFNLKPKIVEGATYKRAVIHSKKIYNVLNQYSPQLLERSGRKEVPNVVMQCKNSLVAHFLKALFDCDSTVHLTNREVTLYSSSKKLLQQIHFLLLRFGITSQIHMVICNRKERVERSYKLTISGENLYRYRQHIGFLSSEKMRRLDYLLNIGIKPRPHIDVIPNVSPLLKIIREKLRLTQRNLRKVVKSYNYYESGGNPPTLRLKQIILIFKNRLNEIKRTGQRISEKFDYDTFIEVRRILKISQQKVAGLLGVSRSLMNYYKNRKKGRNYKKILKRTQLILKKLCKQILTDNVLNEYLSRLEMLVNSDILWDKIVKIEHVKNTNLWVYDLKIPKYHRFIANTFLVHNSQWFEKGEKCSPEALAQIVRELKRQGCRNANLVGGEPTPWLAAWLETFNLLDIDIPVVWNSNSYYSEEAARMLADFADVYLLDFKYGSNECAERISSAPKYVETARRNHLYAVKNGELIIRVLVLPGHLECCTKPILEWIAENLGTWVRVNLMDQYRPEWRAGEIPELRRRLKPEEFEEALSYAKQLGLTNLCF